MESLLGYKPEEVAGKHYRELLTPESLEVVVAALAEELAPEAMRTKDPHRSRVLELEFRTRAGHTLWGELNISFMLNSENIPAGIVGVIRDITDRRGTRQALERSLQAQKAINDLLQISLEHVSTGEMLERMVARIVAMPWFSTHARGEVLLVDSATGALALRAESGPAVVSAAPCAGMKMGGRLCEKAAAHADAARGGAGGEDNLLLCRSGTAQSRYCVPLSTAGKPLGALTLCLAPGRVLGDKETEFLQAAGRVLAGSIERMEAAKTLRRSEADYHAIFDNASDCIFLHDPETARILDVNRKTCEMFGYSREEMLRLSVADISAGERAAVDEAALARLRNAARKGSELFEWLCKDRSGRVFWVEVNLSYARLGSAERVIAFVRDVDARKRAELRVLALGRFLEGMMDALGIWITASDTDGNILVWNAAAEAISGYSREEVLGNNSVWERLFPAGGEDAGAVRRCVDGSGGESRCDHCRSSIVTRDGASRLIHWNFFGLSVDDGRPCGTVTLAFDVSGGAGDSGGGPDLKREIVEALRSCA